jgi:hypothetical protein
MARFDRFKKLERARPDAPDPQRARTSSRFGNLGTLPPPATAEVSDPAAAAADDAQKYDREYDRAKAERAARVRAQLDAEAQRVAELRMRDEAAQDSVGLALVLGPGALAKLSTAQRAYVLGGSLAMIAALAALVSKAFWGLAPIALGVVVATEMIARSRRR